MTPPHIEQHGRSWFQFTWPDTRIELSQLKEHSTDASITCRIAVTLDPPDFRKLLHSTAFKPTYVKSIDLVSQTLARKHRRQKKSLEEAVQEWSHMVEFVAEAVQARLAMSESSIEISAEGPIAPIQYLVYPLLPLDEITVLFGEGGSLKSYLAKVACLIAKGGEQLWPNVKGLGLVPPSPDRLCQTLWLDYETDPKTFKYRLARLCEGHKLDPKKSALRYLRCSIPLVDDLDRLAREVRDNNVGLIVVDSMGMGAGGDINTQAIASSFFLALRSLGRTALVITHEAKEQQLPKIFARKKTPYGSVYVINAARSVWRVEKKQESASPEARILITHQKANDTAYFKPLSYKVTFGDMATTFAWSDTTDVPEFDAKTRSLKARIVHYLGENGAASFEELLSLDDDPKQLGNRLRELSLEGEIQEIGHEKERNKRRYCLLYKELPFND